MESAIDETMEFLNKEIPDWKSQINWETFDMDKIDLCIAGQLNLNYRSSPGFHMPESIARKLPIDLLLEAYHHMGEIWKQKAQV